MCSRCTRPTNGIFEVVFAQSRGLTVAGEMCLPDFPCCVRVKNADFAKVYFVLALGFEVEETRAEHNVAHNLVRHRHSVLQVLHELNKDMVDQPFVGRLQTPVQGLVKVGAMFLHRIHDFLHQRSSLLMQSSGIDFKTLHLYKGIRIPNGNKDHGGSRPSPEKPKMHSGPPREPTRQKRGVKW
jgi:hypothetical protein